MIKGNATGLQHIGIPTKFIEKTIQFYEGLDFEIVSQNSLEDNKSKIIFMKLYNIVIEVYESNHINNNSGSIDHIAINVKDVAKLFESFKIKGYKILNDEVEYLPLFGRGIRFFTIEGINGEKIEFNQLL